MTIEEQIDEVLTEFNATKHEHRDRCELEDQLREICGDREYFLTMNIRGHYSFHRK